MNKKSAPLGDIVRSIKTNTGLVIGLAVILVIAAYVYIPTVKQELGAKPSEAFDAGEYSGDLDTGIPIPWSDLSITLDPTTPPASIFLCATQDNIAAKFRWKAVGQDFIVKKLTLYFPDLRLNKCGHQLDGIAGVKITYTNSIGQEITKGMPAPLPPELTIPPIPMAKLVFSDLDIYVPRGQTSNNHILLVSFDTKPMYPGIPGGMCESSDFMSVGIGNSYGNYEAVGQAVNHMGQIIGKIDTSFTNKFITSPRHVLYGAKLTVTDDNLELAQTTLNPGETNDLYKFEITVDIAGSRVQIKRLTFSISIYNNPPLSSDVNLGGFSIWRDGVEVTKTIISDATGKTMKIKGTNDFTSNSGNILNVQFIDTEAQFPYGGELSYISSGYTATWTLKGMVGSDFSTGDFIDIQLLGISKPANLYGMGNKIIDSDFTETEYLLKLIVFEPYCNPPFMEEMSEYDYLSYFIWSDTSVYPGHSDYVADLVPDGVPTTNSSSDFTGAYLIKHFPMPMIELST